MNSDPDPISVVKYDAVVRVIREQPELSHEEVASFCKVATSTVKRIWDGSISRPPIVVLDRLRTSRRCPQCGALCNDWPCVTCEIQRRRASGAEVEPPRFQYRKQPK